MEIGRLKYLGKVILEGVTMLMSSTVTSKGQVNTPFKIVAKNFPLLKKCMAL